MPYNMPVKIKIRTVLLFLRNSLTNPRKQERNHTLSTYQSPLRPWLPSVQLQANLPRPGPPRYPPDRTTVRQCIIIPKFWIMSLWCVKHQALQIQLILKIGYGIKVLPHERKSKVKIGTNSMGKNPKIHVIERGHLRRWYLQNVQ